MGHSAARPPAAPGNRCFLQRETNRAASCWLQSTQTPDCARSSPTAGRSWYSTPHLGLDPGGPTALTLSHQMRPWCRHAGTPPQHEMGVLARRRAPPQHSVGVSANHSPGAAAPAAAITRRVAPWLPAYGPGAPGLATAARGPLASTRRD